MIHKQIFVHPFQVLAFLQDVSDRVDKEDVDSAILLSLERNRNSIVQGNWQEALDERVRDDLRKHRTYNPKAVRDLLRALRNKGSTSKRHPRCGKFYFRLYDRFNFVFAITFGGEEGAKME